MEKYIVDEQNGLEYELVGDYYIVAGEDEPPARPIGVWGTMRRDYLKRYRQSLYYQLLLSGKLNDHLADMEEQAQDLMWTLTKQMAKAEGVTEELKRKDQMAWVGAMNSIQSRVREIVNHELIFS
ncbi:MAG: TnpV protein [Clostridiales bacterium]|nr:TnpV protein [Clostridiales bacterium]